MGEPAMPGPEHDVVVGHHGERYPDVQVAELRHDARRRGPFRQGARRRRLDRGAVHDRVREGDADLERVGAGGGDGPHDVTPFRGESTGDVRDEELATGVPRRPESGLERTEGRGRLVRRTRQGLAHRSSSITSAASLSPRPDRVTSTVEPVGISPPAARIR